MLVTLIDTALEETTSHSPARTLADVRDVLARLVETDPKETKLQLSAINTIARASHCAPEDLSADPARLRQHLHSM